MGKFCKSCGKERTVTSVRFCEYCGAPIEPDEHPAEPGVEENPSDPIPTPVSEIPRNFPSPLPSSKKPIPITLIIGAIVIAGIFIIGILMLSGIIALPQGTLGFTSEPSVEHKTGGTSQPPLKQGDEQYTNLASLPRGIVILGQIHGPIPGRGVEFVFEAAGY